MNRRTNQIKEEFPWTMMFADDIVICRKSKKEVKVKLERWRDTLERRGMKVSRSMTVCLYLNKNEDDSSRKLQDVDLNQNNGV